MTMGFRTVVTQLESILNAGASVGGYRVAGYQTQQQSADQVKDSLRVVRIYYDEGDFPKKASSRNRNAMHDISIPIELTVSKVSEGNLSALDSAGSSAERLIALNTFVDANKLANDFMDEFIDVIYNVVMAATQMDLGLSVGAVTNTWISNTKKDKPVRLGEMVVLTANMNFGCRVSETFEGLTGETADPQLKAVLANITNYINESVADEGLAAFRGGD